MCETVFAFPFSTQMLVVTLVLITLVMDKIKADERGVFFKIEESYFLSTENTIWNRKADSLLPCSQMCAK